MMNPFSIFIDVCRAPVRKKERLPLSNLYLTFVIAIADPNHRLCALGIYRTITDERTLFKKRPHVERRRGNINGKRGKKGKKAPFLLFLPLLPFMFPRRITSNYYFEEAHVMNVRIPASVTNGQWQMSKIKWEMELFINREIY